MGEVTVVLELETSGQDHAGLEVRVRVNLG